MSPREAADRLVRFWPLIVAVVGIIAAATIYAESIKLNTKRITCIEERVTVIEQTLPAIQTDVSWIRATIERWDAR